MIVPAVVTIGALFIGFAVGRWYEYRALNRTWRSIPRKARRNFIADARGWEREP